MAEYLIQGDSLTALANVIREKTGSSDAMYVSDMVTKIGNLHEVCVGSIQDDNKSLKELIFTGCKFIPNVLFMVLPDTTNGTYLSSLIYIDGMATVLCYEYTGSENLLTCEHFESFAINVDSEAHTFQVTYTSDDDINVSIGTTWIAAKI